MSTPHLVVVGAGPGVGAAVARRFGEDGYSVTLLSLDPDELESLAQTLRDDGIPTTADAVDVTDEAALRAAVTRAAERSGRIDVLHFNPSAFRQQDPLHLSVSGLLEDVALGVGALLTAVQAAVPFMPSGGRVTVTGSMAADQPWHEAASLGVQKAAVRNLVLSLDRTLEARGVRAVSVTVRGSLAREGPFSPARVAEAIHAAAQQPEESWRPEVPYEG